MKANWKNAFLLITVVAIGACVKVFEGHSSVVVNAVWYPDQRHIISSDEGAEVRVWKREMPQAT